MPKLAAIFKKVLAGKVGSEIRKLSIFLAVFLTVFLGCFWLTTLVMSVDYISDIAVDKDGNYYLVDSDTAEVRKFTPDGKLLMTFGGAGKTDGKFRRSDGLNLVTIDLQGNVYAGQSNFDRPSVVQKFDAKGSFLRKWEISDARLVDMAVDSEENLYLLLDDSAPFVQKYDAKGNLSAWQGSFLQNSGLDARNLSISSKNTVIVTGRDTRDTVDTITDKLYEFDPEGHLIAVRFYRWLYFNNSVIIDKDGNLYVHQFTDISKYNLQGERLQEWTEPMDLRYEPINTFTLDNQNNLHYTIRNEHNERVVKRFDPDGNLAKEWVYNKGLPFGWLILLFLMIGLPNAFFIWLLGKAGYISTFIPSSEPEKILSQVSSGTVRLATLKLRQSKRRFNRGNLLEFAVNSLALVCVSFFGFVAQIGLFYLVGAEYYNSVIVWASASGLSFFLLIVIGKYTGQTMVDNYYYKRHYLPLIQQLVADYSLFFPKKTIPKVFTTLRLIPSPSLWWVNRAFRCGDYEKALRRATKLRRFNKSPLLRQVQIASLIQLDHLAEAEYLIQEALTSVDAKRAANLAEILSWLAFVRQKQGRYAESLYIAEKVLELNPADSTHARLMAESYLLGGVHPDRALELLDYAKKHHKSFGFKGWCYRFNPVIEANVAWALAQTGEFSAADKLVEAIEARLANQKKKTLPPYVSTVRCRIAEIEKLRITARS